MTKLLEASSLSIRPDYAFFMMAPRFEISSEGAALGEIIREAWGDFAISDAEGGIIGRIFRPWVFWRTRVEVSDATGPIGSVVQSHVLGRMRFAYEGPGGELLADVSQDGLGAVEFRINTADGRRIGSLSRNYRFWRTGDYELSFAPEASAQLRMLSLGLVVAADAAIQRRRRN
jgi:uncharacterized protein YxjI